MKNLLNILTETSLKDEIEEVKREIRGKESVDMIDTAIEEFSQHIVYLVGSKRWGSFFGNSDNWFHDLLEENLEFFNEKKMIRIFLFWRDSCESI